MLLYVFFEFRMFARMHAMNFTPVAQDISFQLSKPDTSWAELTLSSCPALRVKIWKVLPLPRMLANINVKSKVNPCWPSSRSCGKVLPQPVDDRFPGFPGLPLVSSHHKAKYFEHGVKHKENTGYFGGIGCPVPVEPSCVDLGVFASSCSKLLAAMRHVRD